MLLAFDVGNTHTVVGLFDGPRLAQQWRVTTASRTADELGLVLLQLLGVDHAKQVGGVIVGSVVNAAFATIDAATRRYLGVEARGVDPAAIPGLPLRVDHPEQVGPDRVINLVAALERHPAPLLVVDLGTATTFDAVDRGGSFVGGAISPGVNLLAEALAARTSRLPRVEVHDPGRAIGRNTVEAMQSGLYLGYAGLVDGLARRTKAELGGAHCVATGGLAPLIAPACAEIDEIDPTLTLRGLRLCYERSCP